MSPSPRAIIQISTTGKNFSRINYSRRMYAVIRRYTPDVAEGNINECFADITGLRTFFKMSYKELAEKILKDLNKEIGVQFTIRITSMKAFQNAKTNSRNSKSISTYKELNKLFAGLSFVEAKNRKSLISRRRKFAVPFIGKVA